MTARRQQWAGADAQFHRIVEGGGGRGEVIGV